MGTMPSDEHHARLNRLLAEFGGRVRAAIEARCSGDQGLDPDDIEQDVRIRLWQALERDRNVVFAASYIQRVVLSAVIDASRRAQVRAAEPLPEGDRPAHEALVLPEAPQA